MQCLTVNELFVIYRWNFTFITMDDVRLKNRDLNLQEFRSQSVVLKSRPSRAWISFAGKCNLKCVHCPRSTLNDILVDNNDLSPEVFGKLEKDLLPFLYECKVGGNNLGEQLLAKQWDSFSGRIGKYLFRRYLVTNGLLLNRERITHLVRNGWSIDFSIEGATKETYKAIRGGDFDKFIEIVRECCNQKKNISGTNSKVRFGFTIFYDNIEELIPLIEIGAKIGVDEILVAHLIPTKECQRNQSLVYHKGLYNFFYNKAITRAQKLGVLLKLPSSFPIMKMNGENGNGKDCSNGEKSKKCYHPWTSASINEKGDVFPCCVFDKPMGNLREANFNEVWNGRKFQKIRSTVNSSRPIGNCRNCPLRGDEYTHLFCNEERELLSIIGITNNFDTVFFIRSKVREVLGGSTCGKKIIGKFKSVYRKFIL